MPLDDPTEEAHAPGVRIGQALKEVREAAQFTQERLAGQLGFKQSKVSRWEKGEELPSLIAALPDLDRALGASVGTILRAAGFVEDTDVESAILADRRVDVRDRRELVRTYRRLLSEA